MKQVTWQSNTAAGELPKGQVSGPVHLPDTLLDAVLGLESGHTATAVAMRLERGSDRFSLVLLDESNTPLLALGPYEEEDVVAEWRTLAAASGLLLKIQLVNGSVIAPYPQLGRVLLGATRQRRRHNLLNHRRPRFLSRRKTAEFPLRPQVHREAELVEGARTHSERHRSRKGIERPV
jgi:hypothetical protein